MLPTFIIGLREGVEASLIVGIVAAFLRQRGHRDGLRAMWLGVALAVLLCAAAGVGLQLANRDLPQRQQEQLETVVALIAVAMVTWMIIWMRRNVRGLAATLRANAAHALAEGSAIALVAMAFFAVIREGFETSVFLLAAFQNSTDPTFAGGGAAAGLVVAVVLGFLIYRGGVKINLDRFFRVTAVLLVLVAAGLVASAIHTAHEAAWLNSLQSSPADLRWLVRPGTVPSSLLTGMFGLQPRPTIGEVGGYLLYLVPVLTYVLWPVRQRARHTAESSSVAPATSRTA